MLRPKRALRQGDTLGFVAPSSGLKQSEDLQRAAEAARSLGFCVKLGESCGLQYGYLSGEDEVRARDLNAMFADDSVDAIVCIRGGYGAPRLMDRLDYALAAQHPKILLGYSDVTALHLAYQRQCGLVTFHGPMPTTEWIQPSFDDFTRTSMLRALTDPAPLGEICNPDGCPVYTLSPGRCEGVLIGGNLSLICGLLGSPYGLDARGKVLVIEDVDEYVHRLDRMFNALRLAGVFEQCAGIVLGGFTHCDPETPERSLTIDQVIRDVVLPCKKPVLSGFMIGHCSPKITLPMGVRCALDADRGTLTLLESAFG